MKTLIAKAKCALLAAIAATAFTACDTEGENVETGYTVYRYNIVYPENQSVTNLAVTLDSDTVSYNGLIRPGRDGYTGQLQVACSDYTTLEEEITLHPGDNIPLLFLPDGTIAVYDSASYLSFNASFILNGGMTAELNGQPIVQGLNYLANEKANGELQFYAEGAADPVGSMPVAITNGVNLNIIQLDETTFIEMPEDTEPEPADNHKCKVRLYYPSGVLDAEEIRVDFYAFDEYMWDWVSELPLAGSVTIKQGEISDYVEFVYSEDGSEYISYMYSITNTATDQKYVDYMTDYIYFGGGSNIPAPDGCNATFKKVTYQILEGGQDFSVLEGLSTRW